LTSVTSGLQQFLVGGLHGLFISVVGRSYPVYGLAFTVQVLLL
jgi:hypothetical protein